MAISHTDVFDRSKPTEASSTTTSVVPTLQVVYLDPEVELTSLTATLLSMENDKRIEFVSWFQIGRTFETMRRSRTTLLRAVHQEEFNESVEKRKTVKVSRRLTMTPFLADRRFPTTILLPR